VAINSNKRKKYILLQYTLFGVKIKVN
jgi:hypothetical protein